MAGLRGSFAAGLISAVLACSSNLTPPGVGDGGTPPDGSSDVGALPTVTYHQDIQPLLAANCVRCHHADGPGPFALETWEDVAQRAPRVVDMVIEGAMPPAQTDPSCRRVIGQHFLPDGDRGRFATWRDEGYPEGEALGTVPPPPLLPDPLDDLGAPDIVARMPAPHVPVGTDGQNDDYLWVMLDHVFEEATYVTATRIVPGVPELVHHADAHLADETGMLLIDPESIDQGELGIFDTATIAGYAPSNAGLRLPEGTAFVVEAGTHMMLGLHYHLEAWPAGEEVPADDTRLEIWTLPAGEVPSHRAATRIIYSEELLIEAGDPESVQRKEIPLGDLAFTLLAVAPHMHFLGTASRLEIVHSDGRRECVLDTPNYDFEWQLLHQFVPTDYVEVGSGAVADLVCVYDNTQENQPYVGGVQRRPQDIVYGGSSLDEMCTYLMLFQQPYSP